MKSFWLAATSTIGVSVSCFFAKVKRHTAIEEVRKVQPGSQLFLCGAVHERDAAELDNIRCHSLGGDSDLDN